MVALVAQDADQLGGQRVIEQADDVLTVRRVIGQHSAFFQALFGGVETLGIKRQRGAGFI